MAALVAGVVVVGIATALAFAEDTSVGGEAGTADISAAAPAAPAPPSAAAPFAAPAPLASSAAARTPRPTPSVWAPSRSLLPARGPLVDPELKIGEWRHVWQVIGLLRARPPRAPVVLLFGDSTAREAVVSDAAWTRRLRRLGVRVRAYTLASHAQSFRHDRRFVDELPPLRGVALIGIGLSRFIVPLVKGPLGRPATFAAGEPLQLGPWPRHYFDERGSMTAAAKLERVAHWQESNVPAFRRLLEGNLRQLARLVKACRRHGLEPVFVPLPLNTAVVAGGLDPEREAMRRGCAQVARELGVRYLKEPVAPDLTDADFYDTVHLLRSGAVKWQRAVSARTAALLAQR